MTTMRSTQEKIMNYIKSEIDQKGYPPTIREIGDAVGLSSSSTVHGHLDRMEKKGLIRRDPTKPRAIDILNHDVRHDSNDIVNIPIVGKVTAGMPIAAIQNIESYFPFPKGKVNANSFMLEVQGESMILAGILDGDYVIVRQQPEAENGEIVVALTDQDEATVKTFYREKGHIRLQPENPSMKPLIFDQVKILGKVVGVMRRFH
ncbi:transcriptional repressor LexA [Paenibacillus taichungensis]